MINKTYIKEIFTSVQGEGLYLGEMQIFIRFCKCNLNCKYCDTKFSKDKKTIAYEPEELAEYILHNEVDTVSLTGGEPLLDVSFLRDFLPLIKKQKKIYLETNGTLVGNLASIINLVDVVAMDIKLESVTEQKNQFGLNNEFLETAKAKDVFVKVVFDENIKKEEIDSILKIVKKHNVPLILQPKMKGNKFASKMDKLVSVYKIFYAGYPNTRLIPQVHKFMNIQ